LRKRYVKPASSGATASNVTAEKVDNPPQKPGSRKYLNSVMPRRSIKTKKFMARNTASKFATRVPGPLDGITTESAHLRREPKTPPRDTSRTGFSSKPIS
jgi:hypothetical protein